MMCIKLRVRHIYLDTVSIGNVHKTGPPIMSFLHMKFYGRCQLRKILPNGLPILLDEYYDIKQAKYGVKWNLYSFLVLRQQNHVLSGDCVFLKSGASYYKTTPAPYEMDQVM
eukprot:991505_1